MAGAIYGGDMYQPYMAGAIYGKNSDKIICVCQIFFVPLRQIGAERKMNNHHASHRPHARWNNYRWTGTYLITIVAHEHRQVFGELRTEPEPHVDLTDMGCYMEQQWLALPDYHSQYGRHISVLAHQVMPDHFHGILRVDAEMDVTLGEIIRGFKIACTQEWRRKNRPYMVDTCRNRDTRRNGDAGTTLTDEQRALLSRMSHRQREEYYAKIGVVPLFDDNYDDTVCFREGQIENAIRYVYDNPRRAAIKRANPELFRLRQAVEVAGFTCTTLGQQFLKDHPMREMLQCSRTLTQAEIDQKKAECLRLAERGVIWVSAGISEGEKQICRSVREAGYPLVVLLNEGFPAADSPHAKYYKPQGVYFEACASGQLLLIEPGEVLFEDKEIAAEVYAKDPRCTPNSKRYRFLALNAMIRRMCTE